MTIVLPEKYHAKQSLVERRINCITHQEAMREDIRALRIGILNIMPQAETYEFSLLFPLGRSVIQIEPIWLKLKTHLYNSTSRSHLESLYVTFHEAIKDKHLDGLIVTGAPVEEIPFEEVSYWDEVVEILTYARNEIASTLGLCWGGLALAKMLGIEKVTYPLKLFGVFESFNINRQHRITGEMDDVFWCPQSRFSGIPDEILVQAQRDGSVNLLAYADEPGYFIFESTDGKYLVHLGHFEYESNRLVEEFLRDRQKGRIDVMPPKNVDIHKPKNKWRAHNLEFFAQWIKYVHEETPF